MESGSSLTTETYGVPTGSAIDYGAQGFPGWVYQLGQAFGLRASTYPGHQETDRAEAGFAPNPQHQNRGIDWAGSVDDMQRFANYLMTVRNSLEQVIFQNSVTGRRVGVAGGQDVSQSGYYADDYSGHTDHVHTRQSAPIPMPGGALPEPVDTLFADVSEFQAAVDDSYPYKVLSIRVCDGTYRDHKFAQNYAWMRRALDSGKLTFGIVYTYVRPDIWQANADTVRAMIDANGGLHPRVALMLDVESGGNPAGNQSDSINRLYADLVAYVGNRARIIGYGNVSDLDTCWRDRPAGIRLVVAGYGANPDYPGKVAHQYTDGQGYGGGLPEGAPPFGNCDMNSADGLTATAFAKACGIESQTPTQTGELTMADATSLEKLFAGTTLDNKPLIGPDGADYRRVDWRSSYGGPSAVGMAGPHTTRSLFDEITLLADLLGRTYTNKNGQVLDVFDLLVGIYQHAGEPVVTATPKVAAKTAKTKAVQ